MTSTHKLQEAAFFIEILHALEERGESLTHVADPALEASFLYAAILNAFYSTVEIMRKEGIDMRALRSLHAEIYADGSKGGERAKTVHLSHTEPSHSGHIPPAGNQVSLLFRRRPKLLPQERQTPGAVNLNLRPQHYFTHAPTCLPRALCAASDKRYSLCLLNPIEGELSWDGTFEEASNYSRAFV
jgi:hypothetical protein